MCLWLLVSLLYVCAFAQVAVPFKLTFYFAWPRQSTETSSNLIRIPAVILKFHAHLQYHLRLRGTMGAENLMRIRCRCNWSANQRVQVFNFHMRAPSSGPCIQLSLATYLKQWTCKRVQAPSNLQGACQCQSLLRKQPSETCRCGPRGRQLAKEVSLLRRI